MNEEPTAPKRSRRTKVIAWTIFILILLIPIKREGIWLPLLFVIFDMTNNLLPENF